jgi:4-amino-4-deoxy-L-arabinose transferase-like glycosyltransferase
MGIEVLGKRNIFASKSALLSVAMFTALIVRVAVVLLKGDVSVGANVWEYGEQAACALRNGGDLCLFYPMSSQSQSGASYPSAYMPPLLSYLWLGLFEVFGNGTVARASWLLINIAAALGSVALVFHLSLKLWPSKWAAFTAAMLLAMYPTFVFVTATYHQTNWAVLLLLVTTAVAVELTATQRLWLYGALGGIACGLAALNRSEMLVIGPLLLALGAAWRRNLTVVLKVGVAGGLAMILLLMPWTVRNYQHFGQFIPTAQSSGYNLWKGYNPYTNGSGNLSEDANNPEGQRLLALRDSIPHDDLYETHVQDTYAEAFESDLENASIGRLLKLTANKVLLLWGFDWTDREITLRPAYLVPWLALHVLAVLGFVIAVRRRRSICTAAACIYAAALGLLTIAYAITTVHARYRMHIEPFLFILAGIGVQGLWIWLVAKGPGRLRSRSGRVSTAGGGLAEVPPN